MLTFWRELENNYPVYFLINSLHNFPTNLETVRIDGGEIISFDVSSSDSNKIVAMTRRFLEKPYLAPTQKNLQVHLNFSGMLHHTPAEYTS